LRAPAASRGAASRHRASTSPPRNTNRLVEAFAYEAAIDLGDA